MVADEDGEATDTVNESGVGFAASPDAAADIGSGDDGEVVAGEGVELVGVGEVGVDDGGLLQLMVVLAERGF